ncbi:MAG: hypothetical protein QXU17_05650 [Archaeoglobaceae archaeon]
MTVLDASALAMILLKEGGWEKIELSVKTAIPELAVIEADRQRHKGSEFE